MNDSPTSGSPPDAAARADDQFAGEPTPTALFAQLVLQQSNLALTLLGRAPHPQTGQTVRDLDAAKLFIDQLEMLEVKTRGNLSAQESALLKQTLMTLRLAFVEAVNSPEPPGHPAQAPGGAAAAGATGSAAEAESKKKFSKTYPA
jgi:hypothetical protein